MIRMTILTCFLSLIASFVHAQDVWTSVVTDATAVNCNDGSIDLTPPNCFGTSYNYTYAWTEKETNTVFSTFQDVSGLGPGEYKVKISGPLCIEKEFNFVVWLKDYDFKVDYLMPNDCEEGKSGPNGTDNGRIKISWNENVSPAPIVTNLGTGLTISNNIWLSDLSAGTHRFHFSVGPTCEWTLDVYLCCCSVTEDYEILENDNSLCENVRDGIEFSINILDIIGASSSLSEDGRIIVNVESPGPNWIITWTSSRPEYQNKILYQSDMSALFSGEYCYTYKDDCNTSGISDCIVVDDCGSIIDIAAVIDSEPSCFGSTDGSIYFELTTTRSRFRNFSIHSILSDDSTGPELENAITELTPNGTFVAIQNLRPGLHKYRVITEQNCEGEITFNIEERWDEEVLDRDACAYIYYCGGNIVRTSPSFWEIAPTEYCYISQLICPLTGEKSDPVNNFNEDLIDFSSVDLEAGTCWVGYPCDDGRIDGEIISSFVSENCRGSDTRATPTVSFTRFCKLDSPSEIDVIYDLDLGSMTVSTTEKDSDECRSCKNDDDSDGKIYYYEAINPYDDSKHEITCCKACSVRPYPLVSTNSSTAFDCLGVEKGILVNASTGHFLILSQENIKHLVSSVKEFNFVQSSTLTFSISPGMYFLTSLKCDPLRVVII